MAWNNIFHHPSNIIHLIHIFHHKTSSILYTSSIIKLIHYPYNIKHLNDCEELVKVLTHRCKKLDGVE